MFIVLQFECFQRGVVSSCSLMVNGASAEAAAASAKVRGLPIGLHLNLTEGSPISLPESVSSIIDPANGEYMRGKMGFRAAISAGAINMADIRREAQAQHDRFVLLAGTSPTHWDGHQHIHTIPEIVPVLADVFKGVATRIPALAFETLSENMPTSRSSFYEEVSSQCPDARRCYAAVGVNIAAPGWFVGYSTMGEDCTPDNAIVTLKQAIDSARRSSGASPADAYIEWMVHPGNPTKPRAKYLKAAEARTEPALVLSHAANAAAGDAGCGDGPDAFSMSADRALEMATLLDADGRIRSFLEEHGVQLASYRDFSRDMDVAQQAAAPDSYSSH